MRLAFCLSLCKKPPSIHSAVQKSSLKELINYVQKRDKVKPKQEEPGKCRLNQGTGPFLRMVQIVPRKI